MLNYYLFSVQTSKSSKKHKSKRQKPIPYGALHGPKLEFDHRSLAFLYHKVMIASLSLIDDVRWKSGEVINILIVGLGGGALSMFLKKYLLQVLYNELC